VRRCWMPQAGLGDDVEMWITENGYATNLGRRLERQVNDLNSTLEDVCGYSGTLNVPEYRYFNLRDNRSSGGDLFDAVGLLFDDYSQKPAFSAYRDHIESCGQDEVGATDGRRLRLHLRLRCHIDGLRAKVKGRDRNRVRRVRFLARGDRVARDRRPPFSRLLAADELGRTPRWRVRARARVDDGLRTRLKRSVRRCR
jgi:hypothetical protein